MTDIFRIADLQFQVTEAYLDALVAEGALLWGAVVQARADVPGHGLLQPFLSRHPSIFTGPMELERWQDIAPRSVSWSRESMPDGNLSPPLISLFGYHTIHQGRIGFSPDGGTVRLNMAGRFDVEPAAGHFGRNLDFEIDVRLEFRGISIWTLPEKECFERIAPLINPQVFLYTQIEDHSVLKPYP